MTSTDHLLSAEAVRAHYEGAPFDSSRTLTRLRGDFMELERRDAADGNRNADREAVKAAVVDLIARVPEELLGSFDRRVLGEARVEPQSNRQRRLREAVSELPPMWEKNRARGEGEALSRHLEALRSRLDKLVELEERHGEDQARLHHNRQERNALIYALGELAQRAGEQAAKPPAAPKRHSTEYVATTLNEARDLVAKGYTQVDEQRPGVLMHKLGDDIAPVEVKLPIWFYVLALQSAR